MTFCVLKAQFHHLCADASPSLVIILALRDGALIPRALLPHESDEAVWYIFLNIDTGALFDLGRHADRAVMPITLAPPAPVPLDTITTIYTLPRSSELYNTYTWTLSNPREKKIMYDVVYSCPIEEEENGIR